MTRVAADIIVNSGGDIMPFSPITHSHPLFVLRPETGADYRQWQAFDEFMIKVCEELWVLTLDGWRASAGVQAEIEYAKHLWKPVKFLRVDGERHWLGDGEPYVGE